MQPTPRKTSKVKEKEITSIPEEKLKKNAVSTPSYLQKSTISDIYSQNKKNVVQSSKAPKKISAVSNTASNGTTKKSLLKSSPSSISQLSSKSVAEKIEKTPLASARSLKSKESPLSSRKSTTPLSSRRPTKETPKTNSTQKKVEKSKSLDNRDVPYVRRYKNELPINVTINSPKEKRKLNLNDSDGNTFSKTQDRGDFKEERLRNKTRTLNDDEIKALSDQNIVDNNAEMKKLSKKLSAKPKSFFVDLHEKKIEEKPKSSDEEYNYEDDFESYESDFDSYHSDRTDTSKSDGVGIDETGDGGDNETSEEPEQEKEKDEENMMDSGSFDLREQRSAKNKHTIMAHITEDAEDPEEKRPSLTDEGFQEMSSSSAVSSMKAEGLDRPMFMDFAKCKEKKRKRRLFEQYKQRAIDLLSMITLHQMSYTLFEMKPIPYDLFMVTYGRSNCNQVATQTFEDGVSEEIQTEEIEYDCKWTQHPIDFSINDIYLKDENLSRKYSNQNEDLFNKFNILINNNNIVDENNKINVDDSYKDNPLRVYLEQKYGAGNCEMLPREKYKSITSNLDFNVSKLSKFLKKVEGSVSRILSSNAGDKINEFAQISKLPFSKNCVTIEPTKVKEAKLSFLKDAKIISLVMSETKSNLIMSVHSKYSIVFGVEKCLICLWDTSVNTQIPVKILVAIDDVAVGIFRGSTNGIFVAALNDSSIHLWDLSEEPTWRPDVASEDKPADLVEINSDRMTETERDREWNLKNRYVEFDQHTTIDQKLQSSAYTSSAINMISCEGADCIVALQFVNREGSQDGGRKIVGQVCSLQREGILTIFSIIQEKKFTIDIGKAFWSKLTLEKTQTIHLIDNLDLQESISHDIFNEFNLNSAKRRLGLKRHERNIIKNISRPNSTANIDRPVSARTKVLPVKKNTSKSWESGIVCYDLKIMKLDKVDNYLVAKNCGEVLCCTRNGGNLKINRFFVANDSSSIVHLCVSPHGLPYVFAGSDSGLIHLCSMIEFRVLLTLDSRNTPPPPSETIERCQSDHKGRFISTNTVRTHPNSTYNDKIGAKEPISQIAWPTHNPCCLLGASAGVSGVWGLSASDLAPRALWPHPALAHSGDFVALLTSEGSIQVHKLATGQEYEHNLNIFEKYVALL